MTLVSRFFKAALTVMMLLPAPALFAAPAQSTAAGTLLVRVDPPASLYVDGRLVTSNATEHLASLVAGRHRLRIVHSDYQELRRTIDVPANGSVSLALVLSEHGVRKIAAAPAGGRGAPAVQPPGIVSRVTDADLASGITFVEEGDFQPAADTLFAATRNLAGIPRLIPEQARGYLYLGVAWIGLDRIEPARRAFALARRLDRTLAPSSGEFSRQVLRVWDESRSIPPGEDIDLSGDARPTVVREAPLVQSAQPAPSDPPLASSPVSTGGPSDIEFITQSAAAVSLQFVVATAGKPCGGTLTFDRSVERVAWSPAAADCPPAFDVPFVELRSPVAAPHGGLLLQFRSERPSIVLMPAPDADLLEDGVVTLSVNELPPDTRVRMRRANRVMLEALDRKVDETLFGLLVDVPLSDLLEHPADYEGNIVLTQGRLEIQPRDRYFLTEDASKLQLAPTSASASVLARAKAAEWKGKELIVRGTFSRPALARASSGDAKNQPSPFVLTASRIEPADDIKYDGPAESISLEDLVKTPPRDRRKLVRVVGKFAGKNAYSELPLESRRNINDWVIRQDQLFSVWITGKRPVADGVDLEASTTRSPLDYWLAVTGTVEERKGFVYLRASRVEIAIPTAGVSVLKQADPPVKKRAGPPPSRPDVTFTAPVDGLEEVSRDQQFLIQFTKPMDEASVRRYVQLRYADDPQVTFSRLTVTYYRDRNFSVIIDPGDALKPGRTLECVLLPGIKDSDDLPLVGTDTPPGRVFRWKVRSSR
jgi:hypothetical protein